MNHTDIIQSLFILVLIVLGAYNAHTTRKALTSIRKVITSIDDSVEELWSDIESVDVNDRGPFTMDDELKKSAQKVRKHYEQ